MGGAVHYSRSEARIFFWRTNAGAEVDLVVELHGELIGAYEFKAAAEVDFVLKRGREYLAVEVKAVQRLRPEHLAGLAAIKDLPGLRRRILVYLGRERLTKNESIEVLPFTDFVGLFEKREI